MYFADKTNIGDMALQFYHLPLFSLLIEHLKPDLGSIINVQDQTNEFYNKNFVLSSATPPNKILKPHRTNVFGS